MLDVDSFDNIISIVRACVAANRADLIEPSLIDRLHVGEVATKIESERAARPAAAANNSIFGGPTPAEADALAAAIEKRFRTQNGPRAS
jgi:hypothetical protein